MGSIKTSDILDDIDFEELIRSNDERSMEERVEGNQQTPQSDTDEQESLYEQLPYWDTWLLNMVEANRQPSDNRSRANER